MAGTVGLSRIGGWVALVELDNPPMNSMNADSCARMLDIFSALQNDHDIRAIVLTGRGRAFCSGADLKEASRAEGQGEGVSAFGKVLERVAASRAPVIAAVNGHCIGGGLELALCCDLRIASTDARFVCAGVNVGLMASTYRLPRLIGISRAKAMLLTGSPFEASVVEAWGLVTALHAPEQLGEAALTLARRIASRAPLSVEATKRFADRAVDLSPEEARQLLFRELSVLQASRDHREAVSAFIEKREPVFSRS
jgi:enoyl-CoA hydratase/carnithine racemase